MTRRRPRHPSIRRHLTARLLAGTLAVSAATVAGAYWYIRGELAEQYDAALLAKARSLAGLVGESDGGDGNPRFELAARRMPEYGRRAEDVDYFQVWRDDGTVLARSPSLGADDLPRAGAAGSAIASPTLADVALPGGRHGRAVWLGAAPSPDDERGPGRRAPPSTATTTTRRASRAGVVVVATTDDEFDDTVRHLLASLVVAAAAMSAGTIGVVVVVVRRGLRPLDDVADAAGRIDATSLDARFDTAGMPAELLPICARLNALLERLDAAFRRERRFTSNVAHELRTPIAELRSSAEVALKWPDDTALAAKGVRDALAIARQMEAVVTALLALVRCEAGRQFVDAEALRVAEVVRDAWHPHAAAARARRLVTEFDAGEEIVVRSDRTLLGSLLGNLFSNVVAYTPPGGRVACTCRPSPDGRVKVVVTNTNADLTAADLARLAEPFWRKDAARSDMAHAGLGLSLVRAYADVLGATVDFAVAGGVFSVSLALPGDGDGADEPVPATRR